MLIKTFVTDPPPLLLPLRSVLPSLLLRSLACVCTAGPMHECDGAESDHRVPGQSKSSPSFKVCMHACMHSHLGGG